MMKITLAWLREHRACGPGRDWFKEYQGDTEIDEVIKALCAGHVDWVDWLVTRAKWTGCAKGTRGGWTQEVYYVNGRTHRTDGPAFVETGPYGWHYEVYYVNGERHRTDGPAFVGTRPDGSNYEEYWVNGELRHERGHSRIGKKSIERESPE